MSKKLIRNKSSKNASVSRIPLFNGLIELQGVFGVES